MQVLVEMHTNRLLIITDFSISINLSIFNISNFNNNFQVTFDLALKANLFNLILDLDNLVLYNIENEIFRKINNS